MGQVSGGKLFYDSPPSAPQKAFRTGTSTRLDDRLFAMCQLKYQPLVYSMLMIHPALYRVDDLSDEVRRGPGSSASGSRV